MLSHKNKNKTKQSRNKMLQIVKTGQESNNICVKKRLKQQKTKNSLAKQKNNTKLNIIKTCSVVLILIFSFGFLYACKNEKNTQSYMRIHIRANSNSVQDQNVKFLVKDEIVEFLTPLIAGVDNASQLRGELERNLLSLTKVAEKTLSENGFNYGASVSINNEFFPTRYYDGVLLPSDYYDAIIVRLGSSAGDNWWCVVYPPLCFVGTEIENSNNIVYKSKLQELINNFFK